MTRIILKLDDIRDDGGTQPRDGIDYEAVVEYADLMTEGAKFPPVVVFHDGKDYWLADGFHRVKAAYTANLDEIACELHQGTQADAIWYSFGANKTNGIRRTNADKQRAVQAALRHPKAAGLTDREIARHVGVDHKTVAARREKPVASGEIPQIESRTVTRNGKTYQQNTGNIGRQASTTPGPCHVPVAPSPPACEGKNPSAPVAVATEQATTTAEPDATDRQLAECCQRFHRLCVELTECLVNLKDLAAVGRSNNFDHLTKQQLEKMNELTKTVLAQAGID